ncbi:hypothetical protein [Cellulosimicrobium marinum]|uniref:hypothetical protein n=1 Tax=Cellulosimicrobium marinum TaxID=1638992 RepID=UPI001E3A6A4B|nr:hypothetical protein [Cellulosimicrobium marinum]MCB7137464.1 hypothetical protein [Cellulosimicrobium marinum]
MSRTTAERHVALVPADAVRAAALLSLVVAALVLGGVAGALFLLVLGGVTLTRGLDLPPALDVAYGTSLLAAGWAAQLGWYDAVPGLDLVAHVVCTGLIAAVAHLALVRWRLLPPAPAEPSARARAGLAVTTTALGALVAVLWEVGEWAGHTFLDDGIGVGYTDTVLDLAAGVAGALLAGALLARRRAGTAGRS